MPYEADNDGQPRRPGGKDKEKEKEEVDRFLHNLRKRGKDPHQERPSAVRNNPGRKTMVDIPIDVSELPEKAPKSRNRDRRSR